MRSFLLPITQSSQPAAIRYPFTYNAIISTSWNTLLLSRLVAQSVLNHLPCTPLPSHPPAAVCFQPSTICAPSLLSPTSYGLFSTTCNAPPSSPPDAVCFQPPAMCAPSAICFQPPTMRNPHPHQLRSIFNHLQSVFNHLQCTLLLPTAICFQPAGMRTPHPSSSTYNTCIIK